MKVIWYTIHSQDQGATALMAYVNNRQYLGSETCKSYCDIALKRLHGYQACLLQETM